MPESSLNKTKEVYDAKYSNGRGWKYGPGELANVDRMLTAAGWGSDSRIIEIGCGEGWHANAFAERGINVTAIDISTAGINNAKARYQQPNLHFEQADLARLEPAHKDLDGILCRGMSWFHYRLDEYGVVDMIQQTGRLFSWIRPGGTFLLQIATNFSGTRPAGNIHNNRVTDYLGLFERFGEVTHVSDWYGNILPRVAKARGYVGITIVTRKK